jgi:hypothetical protein
MTNASDGAETADSLTTPPGYAALSAADKAAWLWDHVVLPTAHVPSSLPPLRLPFQDRPLAELGVVLRRDELDQALTDSTELLDPGRPKVIHAHGAVAMVELDTDANSPFTGLLAPPPQGGAVGLVRLSLVAKVVGKAAVTPGMGLKLLIDGGPSADVLAMNHVVGQGRDFDFFSNTMTNDLSDEHSELRPPQRIMGVLFRRVSRQPRKLVSTHLAAQHRDGTTVADPVAPRRLVLHPTEAARQAFVGQAGVDFRRVLADLPAGTDLFEVEGLTGPAPAPGRKGRRGMTPGVPIGVLRTTTAFVSSDGGDRLRFRHVQDPADLKLS